ncbi:hypothetical protein Csa_009244 [Cucumis sativus]|uniref:Uncharacterized protein n=1 Tax=Cucumis sativus TaxID=3659 RepID=A0A0A0KTX4_CUCSA|nr:hypothetical protein Csa_009244 [Cucumis sativus]
MAMVSACVKCGDTDFACSRPARHGVKVNEVPMVSVLTACAHLDALDKENGQMLI